MFLSLSLPRGVGCIFTEMISGQATFPGKKDAFDQLNMIFKMLGTPTEQDWEGVTRFTNYDLSECHRSRGCSTMIWVSVIDLEGVHNFLSHASPTTIWVSVIDLEGVHNFLSHASPTTIWVSVIDLEGVHNFLPHASSTTIWVSVIDLEGVHYSYHTLHQLRSEWVS